MSFKANILPDYLFKDQFNCECVVLKPPTIIELLFISPIRFINVCCIYLGALRFGSSCKSWGTKHCTSSFKGDADDLEQSGGTRKDDIHWSLFLDIGVGSIICAKSEAFPSVQNSRTKT